MSYDSNVSTAFTAPLSTLPDAFKILDNVLSSVNAELVAISKKFNCLRECYAFVTSSLSCADCGHTSVTIGELLLLQLHLPSGKGKCDLVGRAESHRC